MSTAIRCVLLAAALSTPPAAAQSFDPDHSLDWPSGLFPSSTTQRVEVGDPLGNGQRHAFFLRGQTLSMAYQPRFYESIFLPPQAPVGVLDFCLVHQNILGPTLQKQDVFYTTNQGLWSTGIGAGGWAFTTPVLINGGNWAGAQRVRTFDLDGTQREDLVGVNFAGTSALVLLSQSGNTWSAGPTLTPGGFVLDVLAGNFDSDPDREIAVFSSSKLSFYELDGMLAKTYTHSAGGVAGVFKNGSDSARQRIAYAVQFPGPGNWSLFTADAQTRDAVSVALQLVPPGGGPAEWVQPTSLTAVDLGGGAETPGPDLAMTHNSWPTATVFENVSIQGSPQFNSTSFETFDLANNPEYWLSGATAEPGIAGLNGSESAPGGVFPLQAPTAQVDAVYVVPELLSTIPPQGADFILVSDYVPLSGGDDNVRLELTLALPVSTIEKGYDHLELTLWEMNPAATPTNLSLEYHEVYEIDPDILDDGNTKGRFDLDLLVPGAVYDSTGSYWPLGQHFLTHYRFVKVQNPVLDQPTAVSDVADEYLGGLTVQIAPNNPPGSGDWLVEQPQTYDTDIIQQVLLWAGLVVGAYVGLKKVPKLDLPAPPLGNPILRSQSVEPPQ